MQLTMKRIKFWAGAGLLIVALCFVFYLLTPTQPYRRAIRLVDAIADGDGAMMNHFSLARERELLGLNSSKFQRVWNELVQPRIQSFSQYVSQDAYNEANGAEGVCHRIMRAPSGRTIDISAAAFVVDSGDVEQLMMSHILQTGWFAEYITNKDLKTTKSSMISAMLSGIRADKHKLLEIGVPGILDGDEDSSTVATWDELEERCASYLNKAAQTKQD